MRKIKEVLRVRFELRLCHQKFFRLEEVNRAIRELLERLNQRPFRKREGSRARVDVHLVGARQPFALRPALMVVTGTKTLSGVEN
jgi:hypothetical protein